MTAYKNFVQDFPLRCQNVLDFSQNHAKMKDCEVTLLLSVATPGLIMPFERLCKDAHPSRDSTRFTTASQKLSISIKEKCMASEFWKDQNWKYKKLKELQGDPDAWKLDSDTTSIDGKQTSTILTILRNALAHGNIWTTGDPINTIIFLSLVCNVKPNGPFHCLQCSPTVFEKFLRNWFNYLGKLDIPGDVFVETNFFEDKKMTKGIRSNI